MKIPLVCIVGRPNVGKSTIFNRLIKKRHAIVDDETGVTRDRLYATTSFLDHNFNLVDTGGITLLEGDFNREIEIQTLIAVDQADVILFIVDGKEGVSSEDRYIANTLRKTDKPVFLVINKIDHKNYEDNKYDFYELGFDTLYPVCGSNGLGIYELLEEVIKKLPSKDNFYEEDESVKISVVGRPNVGKSSLVNMMLDEKRSIVSPIAGTTRDSIDTRFNYNDKEYILIDTAGLRKKGKVYESIERYSYLRTIDAIERSDIVCLLIDASEGVTEQDKHIAGYVLEKNKAIILICNKIDLVSDLDAVKKQIEREFVFVSYAPVIYTSAISSKGLKNIMTSAEEVYEAYNKSVSTHELNDLIKDAYYKHLPSIYKQKRLKIHFVNQVGIKPPTFLFRVNDTKLIHFSYERYLINTIREHFLFDKTPIVLKFVNKEAKTVK